MKNIANTILLGLCACGLLILSACDDKHKQKTHSGPPPVLTQKQQDLFHVTCMNCHDDPNSGAPQRGDVTEWNLRWSKGFDQLFNNTVNGFNGMPALGGCSSCSQQDLEVFIQYLAGRSQVNKESVRDE